MKPLATLKHASAACTSTDTDLALCLICQDTKGYRLFDASLNVINSRWANSIHSKLKDIKQCELSDRITTALSTDPLPSCVWHINFYAVIL